MGKFLKIQKFTTGFEIAIVTVVLALVLTGVYLFAPGLRVEESKQLDGMTLNGDNLNNVTKGALLSLPSEELSTKVPSDNLIRIAEYAWNGNSGMIVANGGPKTTEGSLMEAAGVNLEIVRQDMFSELRNMQIKFVEEYASGSDYPKSDKSAFAVSIMGDGAEYYISTTQKSLDEKFGASKYHVQAIAPIGLSYGEDKLIGPKIWKENPESMKGCLISSVVGDGDWILALNYCFSNHLKVNPDPTTYDADAVNFVASQDDDYINSVKELIKSQKSGYTVPLKVVKDGKLTGETINHKIDGATTWTPGDKIAFDALTGFTDVVSTKEFNNQMATTIVVVKEWALQHEKEVISILKQTFTANNQIKQYDSWAVAASVAVAKTYNFETPKYWYNLFKGQKGTKAGLDYNIGGTRVFNYADAMEYYGITGNINRYKSVYEQVGNYLVSLNPCGFNETCKEGPVSYNDAVNTYFLKSINDVDAGTATKADYTATKTNVMAKGEWHTTFTSGSATIMGSSSFKDLETVYNLLVQAENTKVRVVGYTDNTGNSDNNLVLSKNRAQSVVDYLISKGIPAERIQEVDGKGDANPVADNSSAKGKAANRRVEISFLD